MQPFSPLLRHWWQVSNIPDKGRSKSNVTNPDVTGLPAKQYNSLPNNSINVMPATVEIECILMQISANVSNNIISAFGRVRDINC